MSSRCEECRTRTAEAEYPVEGIVSTMTVALCDICAARHGLIERESVEDLLARLGA